jgi:hypothetical protein
MHKYVVIESWTWWSKYVCSMYSFLPSIYLHDDMLFLQITCWVKRAIQIWASHWGWPLRLDSVCPTGYQSGVEEGQRIFLWWSCYHFKGKEFTVLMTCLHLSLVLCNEFLFNLRFLCREILDNSLVLLGFWTSLHSIQINSSFRTKMWIFWTFQIAIVLWLVAKMGAGISIWSFLRFGASLSDHSS